MFVWVNVDVSPKDRVNDFEIAVSGVNRISISQLTRNESFGSIRFQIRGTSATHPDKDDGDTTIEAKLDGKVCGSVKVIVIVPKTICGPCPPRSSSSSSSSGGTSPGPCPEGSHRTAENLVLDADARPTPAPRGLGYRTARCNWQPCGASG